ncbi:MAG: hypothetical protein ACO1PM_27745 [Acidovorax sp.]
MPIEELAPQRQVAVALDGHGSGEVGGGKKAAAGFDLVFGQVQACQSQFNAVGGSPGNTAAVLLPGAAPRQ